MIKTEKASRFPLSPNTATKISLRISLLPAIQLSITNDEFRISPLNQHQHNHFAYSWIENINRLALAAMSDSQHNHAEFIPFLDMAFQKKDEVEKDAFSGNSFVLKCSKCSQNCTELKEQFGKQLDVQSLKACFYILNRILSLSKDRVRTTKIIAEDMVFFTVLCSCCGWNGKMVLFAQNKNEKQSNQIESLQKMVQKLFHHHQKLTNQVRTIIKQNKTGSTLEDITDEVIRIFNLQRRSSILSNELRIDHFNLRNSTQPSCQTQQNFHRSKSRRTLKVIPSSRQPKQTFTSRNKDNQQRKHLQQKSMNSLNNNNKNSNMKKGKEKYLLNLTQNKADHGYRRSISSHNRRKKSMELFNCSLSNVNCKKLSSKRISKKQDILVNKLKIMKDKMANGELVMGGIVRKEAKTVEWDEIEHITNNLIFTQAINKEEQVENKQTDLTNSKQIPKSKTLFPSKEEEGKEEIQNQTKKQNKVEKKESEEKQIYEQIWKEVDHRLSSEINPIGESIASLKALLQKYGEKHLLPLYLLYKKFFYLRSALYSTLRQQPTSLLPNCQKTIPQLTQPTAALTLTLHSHNGHQKSLNELKEQNNKILRNLQKLLLKVKEKKNCSLFIYDILIEDDDIYGDFVRGCLELNLQKYRAVLKKVEKGDESKLWEYGRVIYMAVADELGEDMFGGVKQVRKQVTMRELSVQLKELQDLLSLLY